MQWYCLFDSAVVSDLLQKFSGNRSLPAIKGHFDGVIVSANGCNIPH